MAARWVLGASMTLLAWPVSEANALLNRGLHSWMDLIERIDPGTADDSAGLVPESRIPTPIEQLLTEEDLTIMSMDDEPGASGGGSDG